MNISLRSIVLVMGVGVGFVACGPSPSGSLVGAGGSEPTDPGASSTGNGASTGTAGGTASTGGGATGGGATGGGGGGGATGGTGGGGDGGVAGDGGQADGGADAGGGSTDVFGSAPAYVATLGPSARKGDHPFPNGSPAGQACFDCHSNKLIGGTVYADAAGTQGLAKVEVGVVDSAGVLHTTFTDQDGVFYINSKTKLAAPARVAVRNDTTVVKMVSAATNGNCTSCHDGTVTARIHLP